MKLHETAGRLCLETRANLAGLDIQEKQPRNSLLIRFVALIGVRWQRKCHNNQFIAQECYRLVEDGGLGIAADRLSVNSKIPQINLPIWILSQYRLCEGENG